jgi:hypothetical protein
LLLSADSVGANAIMAETVMPKTTVRRWQARFMEQSVDGLLRDKTRPPGRAPVARRDEILRDGVLAAPPRRRIQAIVATHF